MLKNHSNINDEPKHIEQNNLVFILNEKEKTAGVVKCTKQKSNIIIPRSIIHENEEFIVTSINERAFKYTEVIKSIQCPPNSELRTIEKEAFSDSNIESFTIPSKLAELKEGWCASTPKLTKVTVMPDNPKFMFLDGKFIVGKSNEKSDNYDVLFFSCRDVREATTPSFIKQINSYAFSDSSVKKITFSHNISKICDSAFHSCRKLQQVEFPSNSELQMIGKEAFKNAGIESIVIPLHVTRICEQTFSMCSQLKSVRFLPDSEIEVIEKSAFFCASIQSIAIPSSVSDFNYGWCVGINDLNDIKIIQNEKKNISLFDDKLIIAKTDKKSGIYDVVVFARRDIKNVTIPENVRLIESYSFSNSKIESITFSHHITKVCDFAFYACENLKHVDIPLDSELKIIDKYAFHNSSIESIHISLHITQICEHAFDCCKKLKQVKIPKNSELQMIGKCAFINSSIEYFYISHHITEICEQTFKNCEKLKCVEIPENSKLQIIKNKAFENAAIDSIFIPPHVTKICEGAFALCRYLQRLDFPKNSKLETIEKDAFVAKIKSIVFPPHFPQISDDILAHCYYLRIVEIDENSELPIIKKRNFNTFQNVVVMIPQKFLKHFK